MKKNCIKRLLSLLCVVAVSVTVLYGQNIVSLGSASYTTVHPGYDSAGRNQYPTWSPKVSGAAAERTIPTNDWWSLLLMDNHVSNLFTYPYTLRTVNEGLVVSYIANGVIDDLLPITIGLPSLNASAVTVSDYSDWTVTMNWCSGDDVMEVTAGIAMPFLYIKKDSDEPMQVSVTSGTVTVMDEMLL
ncbi:MAG: hypothetical protein R3Y22_09235, partial [Bacteroidales bacterium]